MRRGADATVSFVVPGCGASFRCQCSIASCGSSSCYRPAPRRHAAALHETKNVRSMAPLQCAPCAFWPVDPPEREAVHTTQDGMNPSLWWRARACGCTSIGHVCSTTNTAAAHSVTAMGPAPSTAERVRARVRHTHSRPCALSAMHAPSRARTRLEVRLLGLAATPQPRQHDRQRHHEQQQRRFQLKAVPVARRQRCVTHAGTGISVRVLCTVAAAAGRLGKGKGARTTGAAAHAAPQHLL